MAISFSRFRKTFSTLWGGVTERFLTWTSSETDSSSERYSQQMSKKMLSLLEENQRLREELRLRDLRENAEYDV